MVFEQFLDDDKVKKHALYILLLGMAYVALGYFASAYFFGQDVSVALLFTTTLLLVPSTYVILGIEEKIERRQGTRHFLHNHKDIFKVYMFLFIGIFLAYFIIGYFTGLSVFAYQLRFLADRGDLASSVLGSAQGFSPSFSSTLGLITQNILAMLIFFMLSLFFGAGGLFLLTLNASVFAAFITQLMKLVSNPWAVLGLFLIHSIPETAGFLVAAIAGGVVSRALVRERIGSPKFKNVMRDAFVLLGIAVALIIVAGILESTVTAPLVKSVL